MNANADQINELVQSLTGTRNVIALQRIYIQITKDPIAGLVLQEIIWGSDHTTNPDGWFYRRAQEWEDQLCLSYQRVRTAIKKLEKLDLIETTLKKAAHRKADGTWGQPAPTKHYRPKMGQITQAILDFRETAKSDFRETAKSESEETPKSCTEPTEQVPTEQIQLPSEAGEAPPPPDSEPVKEKEKPETPVNLDGWLTRLAAESNKQGFLVLMLETLYPKRPLPDKPFGFMAKIAKQVGGPVVMARYLWEFAGRNPQPQEPLVYILQAHRQRKGQRTPRQAKRKDGRSDTRKQPHPTKGQQVYETVEDQYQASIKAAGFG